MRSTLVLVTVVALAGCDAPLFFKSQDATPRWSAAQPNPVITEKWVPGFGPATDWKIDTLRVYGDGRWEVNRDFETSTASPSEIVASGSMTPETLKGVLAKAFERPFGGQSFLDLPEHVPAQVADAPVVTLGVSIDNASHSVTVTGPMPDAFTRFETAIASQTVRLPLQP